MNKHGGSHQMTLAEANRKSGQYLESARKALAEGAHLDVKLSDPFKQTEMKCENGPSGTFFTQQDAQVVGLRANAADKYFTIMRTWWSENGFHVTHDDQHDGTVIAEQEADNFAVSLKVYDSSRYYIDVSSPCVPRGEAPSG